MLRLFHWWIKNHITKRIDIVWTDCREWGAWKALLFINALMMHDMVTTMRVKIVDISMIKIEYNRILIENVLSREQHCMLMRCYYKTKRLRTLLIKVINIKINLRFIITTCWCPSLTYDTDTKQGTITRAFRRCDTGYWQSNWELC